MTSTPNRPRRRIAAEDREPQELGGDTTLLLVDSDETFQRNLARAMESRGFQPKTAKTAAAGRAIAVNRRPAFAVIELRLKDGNGLEVVEELSRQRPDCRIVILTEYGSIATAVAAMKMGASDYLSKPADADTITNALLTKPEMLPLPPEKPMSADRMRWEYIQRMYVLCDRNASETARRLGMHRRTLARIMARHSPK